MRFRAVSGQRTRNESQRPREKKSTKGGYGSILCAAKTENPVPRSFLLRNQTQTLATSESYVSLPDRCRDNFYQNLLARPGPALPQVGPLKVVCHQTCVGLETDLPTIQNTKKERFDRIWDSLRRDWAACVGACLALAARRGYTALVLFSRWRRSDARYSA